MPPGPCHSIRVACEAAGFRKGKHDAKKGVFRGLYRDCFNKVLKYKPLTGVNVPPAQVEACKLNRANRPTRRNAGRITRPKPTPR